MKNRKVVINGKPGEYTGTSIIKATDKVTQDWHFFSMYDGSTEKKINSFDGVQWEDKQPPKVNYTDFNNWDVEVVVKLKIIGPIDLLELGSVMDNIAYQFVPSAALNPGVKVISAEITQWDIE